MQMRSKAIVMTAALSAMSSAALAVDQFKISLGVREATGAAGLAIGANGGTSGPIEWINKDTPTLDINETWQTFTYNFGTDPVLPFTGNGTINVAQGVLEHIRILNSGKVGDIIKVWIDDVTATAVGGSPVQITGFEGFDPVATPNGTVLFQEPRFSGSTNGNLTTARDVAVIDNAVAIEGTQSYRLEFQFKSNNAAEWIRLTTFSIQNFPNPVIDTQPGSSVSFKLRAAVVEPATRWGVDANGDWSNSANWLFDTGVTNVPGTTGNISDVANFLTVATAPRTINVDVPITLNTLRLKDAAGYTFNTSDPVNNAITLTGPTQFTANINAEIGSHTINAPIKLELLSLVTNASDASSVLRLAGGVNFDSLGLGSGVSMQKIGDGRVEIPQIRSYVVAPDDFTGNPAPVNPSRTVTVSGGTLKLIPHAANPVQVSLTNRISIAGGAIPTARLDISDNAFVVNYVDAAQGGTTSPLALLTEQIKSGRATGNWSGLGITSSTAAATTGGAVGIAEATDIGSPATFLGEPVDASSILIRYTKAGDGNLSGGVDLDDFTALAANFGNPGRWATGDFNYDGTVNLDDFTALAANFGTSVPSDAPRSSVPEPGMLSVLGLAAAGLMGRRRRA